MKATIARKIANIKDWHYVIAEYTCTAKKYRKGNQGEKNNFFDRNRVRQDKRLYLQEHYRT